MVNGGDAISDVQGGAFAPLKEKSFRTIWTASLFSNFGQLILGVGAAWEMTRLTTSPTMIALVQTAMMIPLMLVAVPAGAMADMFDRRKIALVGLSFSSICGVILTGLALAGLVTPWILLAACVLIGAGVALYSPAWQASIGEQVSSRNLPSAIALGTISYNVARSFGPAIGGLVVVALGAQAAFGINAIFYLPLIVAFWFWKRRPVPSRLPPESIGRAIVSGIRYAIHASTPRNVMLRAVIFGIATASTAALAPLIAKKLLDGNAATFGILLGASGVGAVAGALMVSYTRDKFGPENTVRLMSVLSAITIIVVAFSRSTPLTCIALFISGGANILAIAQMNVSIQISAPRWVTARVVSLFQASLTGGIALGAFIWGAMANQISIEVSLWVAGAVLIVTPLVGVFFPLPDASHVDVEEVELGNEPRQVLGLSLRSGPVSIEVDYLVDPELARDFYDAMMKVQGVRQRNGGFDWSLGRDIEDPARWIERYLCPTWGDYLRMRNRYTQGDLNLQSIANRFNQAPEGLTVRRHLQRPYGSVRWRAETPDPKAVSVGFIAP